MRTIAAFMAVAAVLMAIGLVAVELVREDPPKILFRRPVVDDGVRRAAALERSLEGFGRRDTVAGSSSGEA